MSSVLVACMAPIVLCHLTRDHLTRSLKSRNATIGDKTWNPGFKSVTLLKVTGGLMDRTCWNIESRPILHAESTCHLHLSIAPLVVALRRESVPIFEDPDFFCCPPTATFHYSQNFLAYGI